MSDLVDYEFDDAGGIATITMDDGKVNAQSPAMLRALSAAFDRAEEEATVVILTGRGEVFSAGFDLKVFQERPEELGEMITLGARLNQRLLGFPRPIVAAVNGNAIAAGAFLALSADLRIGAQGAYSIGLNEVRIGLTVPSAFVELARHRLSPAWFDRALGLAEMYSPEAAVEAGFFDRIVAHGELGEASLAAANDLAGLNGDAHAGIKLRVRRPVIEAMEAAILDELDPGVSF